MGFFGSKRESASSTRQGQSVAVPETKLPESSRMTMTLPKVEDKPYAREQLENFLAEYEANLKDLSSERLSIISQAPKAKDIPLVEALYGVAFIKELFENGSVDVDTFTSSRKIYGSIKKAAFDSLTIKMKTILGTPKGAN